MYARSISCSTAPASHRAFAVAGFGYDWDCGRAGVGGLGGGCLCFIGNSGVANDKATGDFDNFMARPGLLRGVDRGQLDRERLTLAVQHVGRWLWRLDARIECIGTSERQRCLVGIHRSVVGVLVGLVRIPVGEVYRAPRCRRRRQRGAGLRLIAWKSARASERHGRRDACIARRFIDRRFIGGGRRVDCFGSADQCAYGLCLYVGDALIGAGCGGGCACHGAHGCDGSDRSGSHAKRASRRCRGLRHFDDLALTRGHGFVGGLPVAGGLCSAIRADGDGRRWQAKRCGWHWCGAGRWCRSTGSRCSGRLPMTSAHDVGTASHGGTGEQAQHGGMVNALLEWLAEREILQDLLTDGLRQFLEDAFGCHAFEHALDDAFCLGRVLRCANQHRVDVVDAERLGHLGAEHAECGRSYAGGDSSASLPQRQRAVGRLLADLLGLRARAHDTFTEARGAGGGCAVLRGNHGGFAPSLGRCGDSSLLGPGHATSNHAGQLRRTRHQAPTDHATRGHAGERFDNAVTDDRRVLQRGHGGVAEPFGVVHCLECCFLLVRVELVQRGLGFLRAEAHYTVGVLEELADVPTRGNVGEAHCGFRHTDGALECRDTHVAGDTRPRTGCNRRLRFLDAQCFRHCGLVHVGVVNLMQDIDDLLVIEVLPVGVLCADFGDVHGSVRMD